MDLEVLRWSFLSYLNNTAHGKKNAKAFGGVILDCALTLLTPRIYNDEVEIQLVIKLREGDLKK